MSYEKLNNRYFGQSLSRRSACRTHFNFPKLWTGLTMLYSCACSLCSGTNLDAAPPVSDEYLLTPSLVINTAPAAPAINVISKIISGDSRIDALLYNSNSRLNSALPLKTPVTVTYSFPSQMPAEYSGVNSNGWAPFNLDQQAAARQILTLLQKQTNITFLEVSSLSAVGGTIRFSNNSQAEGAAGYAYFPGPSGNALGSDVFMSNTIRNTTNVTNGTWAWSSLLHEIGHALGLKHPGNYNAGGTSASYNGAETSGNYLGVQEDAFFNTIMTYRFSAQLIPSTGFMPYDLLALRYMYGSRAFETGNNTYSYLDTSGRSVANIVDDGGNDTLNFSAITTPVTVDLTPGAYSSIGRTISGALALANLTISLDAVIENVIGTRQADIVVGNSANNVLTGGGGNDVLNGANGVDVAVLSGPRLSYGLGQPSPSNGRTVTDKTGVDGTDFLFGIERLWFSDSKLALDLDGNAGRTVKLLGAVFGPSSVISQGYVAAGLRLLDGGMSYQDLGTLAVQETGISDHAGIVSLLWTNLFGFAPSPVLSAPYVSMLDRGISKGELAVLAAEEPTNLVNIDLIGLTQTGVVYL